jgi:hypothetical protein
MTMPRPLGPLQLRLLGALRHHGREASLQSLAAFAAGLIPDLGTRPPAQAFATWAQYTATARAVAALRRRHFIDTRMAASTRGRMMWPPATEGRPRPVWQFRNPTRLLYVKMTPACMNGGEHGAEV